MSETLLELVAAEQATQAESTDPTPSPEVPSLEVTPEAPEAIPVPVAPSEPPVETPSDDDVTPAAEDPPAAEDGPQIDPFIAEVSEATGMDFSTVAKDKAEFFRSVGSMRRKLSERDKLAKLGEGVLSHPDIEKIRAILAGTAPPPQPAPPEPPPKTNGVPEYNPAWETIVAGENPPPDIVAKHQLYQTWARDRAGQILNSDIIARLASDPEGALAEIIDKKLAPLIEQSKQTREQREQEAQESRVAAVMDPISGELFAGEVGDWQNTTLFGSKVAELFNEGKDNAKDELVWFEKCVKDAKSQLPQPKPTKDPHPAAKRAPAVAAPQADSRTPVQAMEDAQAKADHKLSLNELVAIGTQHTA